MADNTNLSQSQRDMRSSRPRALSRQEIESLRQDRIETHNFGTEAFKHIKGTLAPKKN